jgi:hypothetical protein
MNENKKGQMFSVFFKILLLEFPNTKMNLLRHHRQGSQSLLFYCSDIGPAIRTASGMDRVKHLCRIKKEKGIVKLELLY